MTEGAQISTKYGDEISRAQQAGLFLFDQISSLRRRRSVVLLVGIVFTVGGVALLLAGLAISGALGEQNLHSLGFGVPSVLGVLIGSGLCALVLGGLAMAQYYSAGASMTEGEHTLQVLEASLEQQEERPLWF